MVFEDLNIFLRGNGGKKCALDLATGNVFGVKNAALGMAAFAAEIQ
jgi:hypothetical protein